MNWSTTCFLLYKNKNDLIFSNMERALLMYKILSGNLYKKVNYLVTCKTTQGEIIYCKEDFQMFLREADFTFPVKGLWSFYTQ